MGVEVMFLRVAAKWRPLCCGIGRNLVMLQATSDALTTAKWCPSCAARSM